MDAKPTRQYASTQVDLEEPARSLILQAAKDIIDPADVRELEDDPHVTVKYGLSPDVTVEEIQAQLEGMDAARLTTGTLQAFTNEESDVLYVSIDSPDLCELYRRLSTLLHVDTHEKYTPHLTLAYLVPGTAEKYVGQSLSHHMDLVFDQIVLSRVDKTKESIPFPPVDQAFSLEDDIFHFSGVGRFQGDATEGNIDGVPFIEKTARLFVAGSYVIDGKTYTYDKVHLGKMAASVVGRDVVDYEWDVPIQLDHASSSWDTVGCVRKAWVQGDELWGRLRFSGVVPVEKVKARLWLKLSISHDRTYALSEVSVTPFPRIKTAKLFSQNEPETKEDLTVADNAKTIAAQPQKEAPAPPTAQAFDAASLEASLRAEFAEKSRVEQEAANAREAANAAKFAAQEQEMAEIKRTLRFAKLSTQVETFSAKGLTTPAMRDNELAFMETLSDDQLELYSKLKETQPKLVDFSVYGTQKANKPSDAEDEEYEEGKKAAKKRAEEEEMKK